MCSLLLHLSVIVFLGLAGSSDAEQICESSLIYIGADDPEDQITILDPKINVNYARNGLAVYNYPGTDEVNIFLNETVVSFEGEIAKIAAGRNRYVAKTTRILNAKILGSAEMSKNLYGEQILRNCQVHMQNNLEKNQIDLPLDVQEAILRKASTCLQETICKEIGEISQVDMKNARNQLQEFGSFKVTPKSTDEQDIEEILLLVSQIRSTLQHADVYMLDPQKLEKLINRLIDVSLEYMKKRFTDGRIQVPNLDYSDVHSEWWKPNTYLNAFEGVFSDIRKIWKAQKIQLTLDGPKLSVSANFKIDIASAFYKYKLVWAKIPVSGTLRGTLPDVTVDGLFEYDQTECRVAMESLNIKKNGKINIEFTGLGPLNWLVSIILSSQAEKWNADILSGIRDEIMRRVNDLLSGFSC